MAKAPEYQRAVEKIIRLSASGKHLAALKLASETVKRFPWELAPRSAWGVAAIRARNLPEAKRIAIELLTLFPDAHESYSLFAATCLEDGEHETAAACALQAILRGSLDSAPRFALADALALLGKNIATPSGRVIDTLGMLAEGLILEPSAYETIAPAIYSSIPAAVSGLKYLSSARLAKAIESLIRPPEHYYSALHFTSDQDAEWVELFRRAVANENKLHDTIPVSSTDVNAFARQVAWLRYLSIRVNTSRPLEIILRSLRQFLLQKLGSHQSLTSSEISLSYMLSVQCYLNEYIFEESDNETIIIEKLRSELHSGKVAEGAVEILASYRDLRDENLDKVLFNNKHLKDIYELMVSDPQSRETSKNTLRNLSPIAVDVSREVQAFYEASPYPRWRYAHNVSLYAAPYLNILSLTVPSVILPSDGFDGALDVLVAGVGTGQALLGPVRYSNASITGLDISRDSLVYAQQMMEKIGHKNISFIHGDILDAEKIGKTFDIVECTGVLHHLDDPWAGFRALTQVLRPGGLMEASVYSRKYRQLLEPLTLLARAKGDEVEGDLLAKVRAARQALLENLKDDTASKLLLRLRDFFSFSEFRDLMFHPVERPMSLKELVDGAAAVGLRPLGIIPTGPDLTRLAVERGRPVDIDADISYWVDVEENNPEYFASMISVLFQRV